jgi:hypothetical protein
MATNFDLKRNERTRKVNDCMAKEIKPTGDKLLSRVIKVTCMINLISRKD